ncbi:pyridoxamine 5'-phosphate oxidase family protein [Reichenbachiella agarivorans]|uniref:Pyridoxamine 5'-phosphate oxidase family protein n=1 Tax=Reichenbachiella agarivorans TaxID=2979464 RepID=A0ABY6CS94_9BACT|nr:pyridoxamine 5'-phosphate oxidase family protein [Reichenbachiella agarivorans]UXP33396.1 pyridoxamine 5'-phosphate oxidase family protein [Reichenbachiella agarivorans]
MGKRLECLTTELKEFIKDQKIFFVATAMKEGKVNVSPKGMDSFRVLSDNKVIWLNLTGSGNETATHLLESDRMTIMFCAFEGKPLILRLYGHAKVFHPRDVKYEKCLSMFPAIMGSRQIIEMDIDMVQTSCGMAVPFMDYKEDRNELKVYWEKQGDERIKKYWHDKNTVSIDGHETSIFE